MYNAEHITVDRKTGIPSTIHVPQAAVCVCGGIQPVILQRALSTEHRESGLAARLLLACPPRRAKRWTEADIAPEMEGELVQIFDRIYELSPTVSEDNESRPVLIGLSPDAKGAWIAYYNDHGIEQKNLTGDLSAAWSKLEEYAARLALVIHFIRWAVNDPDLEDSEKVDLASMEAGIALTKWFKHDALRTYALLDENDQERDERRLVEWIARKGGSVTVREVQAGCRWLRPAGTAEAALEALAKTGSGTRYHQPSSPGGGRPTRIFVLSCADAAYETPRIRTSVGFADADIFENSAPAPYRRCFTVRTVSSRLRSWQYDDRPVASRAGRGSVRAKRVCPH